MTKAQKMFIYLSVVFVAAAIGIFLYFEVEKVVTIIYSVITIILLCLALVIMNMTKKEKISNFQKRIRNICKVYDAIIVNTKTLPSLDDRNVVKVVSIENLIDAQMGIRKPIYFKDYNTSCAFVLLGEKEACVLILKEDPEVICPYEIVVENGLKGTNEKDLDHKLLDNIDKTTVIKIDDDKELKVSPIRDDN